MKDYSGFHADARGAFAIVGIGCRLPGGIDDAQSYWDFLKAKKTGIREFPEDRLSPAAFYDPNPNAMSASITKWAGFMDEVRNFDAGFFGLSPREGASMDPQQRLVLQTAYEAMEDAGIPADVFSRQKTGVFVGISQSDYRTLSERRDTHPEIYGGTSFALCIVANRVSHRLDLHGPSFSVDTACSSSLTALDQAVQNLRRGHCEMAIVSGVNLLLSPNSFIAFSRAGMLSSTGQLSAFDSRANGFVRGEGVGTVIIRPLDHALADGNPIHAILRETACNQDGFTSTLTAPNQAAQIDMLSTLLDDAGIEADRIGYVEAHGTGTPIGDPIEAGAIGTVIGQNKTNGTLFMGSVKPNIGHLESGAGINGLIKAVLSVKHGEIAPNINFENPNPNIPLDALNLHVPTEVQEFPEYNGERYAVVNSFGFGGTNASALISSAGERPVEGVWRRPEANATADAPFLFPVTAQSDKSLAGNAERLAASLRTGALIDADLGDLSATLASKRKHHSRRAVIVARTKDELLSGLDFLSGAAGPDADQPEHVITGQAVSGQKVCFMFAGQGSQWWRMGRDLLEHNAVFREAVEAYDAHFVTAAGWSIKDELLKDEAESRIDDTTVTQPALFAIQAGLAAVWKHYGVIPDSVVGHSIGEAAAAYVADGLSLSGAARFLSKRGTIRDRLGAKGAMAAVGMDPEDIEPLLPENGLINIAAVNGPGSTTISGDYDTLHAFVAEFEQTHPDTFIRILRVDTAWHSYQLEAGEAWFRTEVANIEHSVPTIPFISTVTGKLETRFDTEYGWKNLRCPVMFRAGVETALDMGTDIFVELGPHTTLSAPATSTAAEKGAQVKVINSLNRKKNDFDAISLAAARLFVSGVSIDWHNIAGEASGELTLPIYAWANEELWNVDSEEVRHQMFAPAPHPYMGSRLMGPSFAWRGEMNIKAFPWVADHKINTECVFPGAGYMDMLMAAGREIYGPGVIELEHLKILEALFIPADGDIMFWTQYIPQRNLVQIYSHLRDSGEDWVLRAEAVVRQNNVAPPKPKMLVDGAKGVQKFGPETVYKDDSEYEFVTYGPQFRTISKIWGKGKEITAEAEASPLVDREFDEFVAHPSLFDAALQMVDPNVNAYNLATNFKAMNEGYMPIGGSRIRQFAPMTRQIRIYTKDLGRVDPNTSAGYILITDMDGNVLIEIEKLFNRALQSQEAAEHPEGFSPHYTVETYQDYRAPGADTLEEAGRWLVLANADKAGKALIKELKARGADVTLLKRDALPEDGISDALADQVLDLMDEGPLQGIVYAWNLDAPEIDDAAPTELVNGFVTRHTTDLIALGNALDEVRNDENLPRLAVVTRSGRPAPDPTAMTTSGLLQGPLVALLRTIGNETPEIDMLQIDADAARLAKPETLVNALLAPYGESEIVLRETGDLVPRLKRVWPEELEPRTLTITEDDPDKNFVVTMDVPGVIDNLELHEVPMDEVGPDQVRVKIAAVGLNFRDVMAVTALLPREAESEPAWRNLGLEFGGVIDEVGENVTRFKKGDRVMGLGKRCLQRYHVTSPLALSRVPDHITLEEASTIPSAFATAHYALNQIGRMAEGERVFIHVATGGVGTAAVQMARNVGAEIFATAGNPEKRKLLKSWGVRHVMNSRDLTFADQVMKITKGKGVDVLLNSLPGPYIEKGLEIMSPYGRYLEIGKRDVYADSSIGMKALRKNVSVSVLDLAAMGEERPELMGAIFDELSQAFENRELDPLPLTSFPVAQVADAVRYMSQAKHVGKVVVSFEEEKFEVKSDRTRAVQMDPKGSYLVTGGTRGFGLTIADWLSQKGAGQLVLASRSGTLSGPDKKRVEKIEARGTKVEVMTLDINDEAEVETYVARAVKARKFPLKGVLHAAAVIKDGFITQLTDDMIADVIRPKVAGGWNLHKAFVKAGVTPDFILSFSSIAALIGSGGQANYVAANAFLDALAAYRKPLGDTGGAINWGAIGAAGVVARNDALRSYLESVGLRALKPKATPAAVELLLKSDTPNMMFADADWQQMARANAKFGKTPRVAGMLQKKGSNNTEIRAMFLSLEGDELLGEIEIFVKKEIGSVLKVDPDTIGAGQKMNELGLDSLSSFELKMRLETALDIAIPVARFLQAPTVQELVGLMAEEVERIKAEALRTDDDSAGADAADAGGTAKRGHVASDRSLGLLRDAVAPMTTDSARAALEHRVMLRVAPAPTLAALEKAVDRLVQRHPMLTARFDPAKGAGELTLEGGAPNVLEQSHIDPDAIPALDVAASELVRVTLEPAGDDGAARLLVQLHAGIGDAASAYVLLEDLVALLAGEKPGKALNKGQVFNFLEGSRYDMENPRSENDRSFWHYSMGETAPAVRFPDRAKAIAPVGLGRNHGASITYAANLPAGKGPDAASAVLALAEAVAEATGHEAPMLIARRVSRRATLARGQAVGPFETEQPFFVPADDGAFGPKALVARRLDQAAHHDSFDLYAATQQLAQDFGRMGAAPFQVGLTHLHEDEDGFADRLAGGPVAVGDLTVRAEPLEPEGIAHDVELAVIEGSDKIRITLRIDSDVVRPAQLHPLLAALNSRFGMELAPTVGVATSKAAE